MKGFEERLSALRTQRQQLQVYYFIRFLEHVFTVECNRRHRNGRKESWVRSSRSTVNESASLNRRSRQNGTCALTPSTQ